MSAERISAKQQEQVRHHEWRLNYYDVKRLPVELEQQINPDSCGAAVLSMVYKFYEKPIPQNEIWNAVKKRKSGGRPGFYTTTYDLVRHAKKQGFETFTGRLKLRYSTLGYENIKLLGPFLDRTVNKYQIPLIICWRRPESIEGHYSIISGFNGFKVEVLDPLETIGNLFDKEYLQHFWQPLKLPLWEVPEGVNLNPDNVGGTFLAMYPKGKLKNFVFPKSEGVRIFKNL